MQKLRSIHLYLGCVFAPLLVFFAVSGVWQTVGFKSELLLRLSTIHTADTLKDGNELGSVPLRVFVILMAVSFVITTVLGVVMALRFGQSRKVALYCLASGALVPTVLVLLRML